MGHNLVDGCLSNILIYSAVVLFRGSVLFSYVFRVLGVDFIECLVCFEGMLFR